jgi:protein-tyrosine phosphatase
LGLIDFHTHILPGIDDGSRDIDMTARMLDMEREQGVSHIYATPHFYAHRRSIDYFIERRNRSLAHVRNELLTSNPQFPRIIPGAEVYYFTGMGRAEQLPELCIEGTNIILIEMPFDQWHRDAVRDIDDIIHKRQLQVVLAHVERYEHFQRDDSAWNEIISMPLTIQINCEAFTDKGHWLRGSHLQKFALRMLDEKASCIIGSDCHNLTERKPNIQEARTVIEKKLGSDRLSKLDAYTNQLLCNTI